MEQGSIKDSQDKAATPHQELLLCLARQSSSISGLGRVWESFCAALSVAETFPECGPWDLPVVTPETGRCREQEVSESDQLRDQLSEVHFHMSQGGKKAQTHSQIYIKAN